MRYTSIVVVVASARHRWLCRSNDVRGLSAGGRVMLVESTYMFESNRVTRKLVLVRSAPEHE